MNNMSTRPRSTFIANPPTAATTFRACDTVRPDQRGIRWRRVQL